MSGVHKQIADDQPAVDSGVNNEPFRLFGTPIMPSTMGGALETVDRVITQRGQLQIGVVNAAKIVNMQRNEELRDAVHASDVIFADGMSIVWASRALGQPLPERVAGIDLMYEILRQGNEKNYRIYCLGAKPEVVKTVAETFRRDYPGVSIVGARDGYFALEDEREIADEIRAAKPDVLFVGISSPKKERFMARWAAHMDVPVVHGVGGSFDVAAGLVARAPLFWRGKRAGVVVPASSGA